LISTEATCEIAMLSSLVPNSRDFTRLTWSGVTTIRVGKRWLPRVQRLAAKVWLEAAGTVADGVAISHSGLMIHKVGAIEALNHQVHPVVEVCGFY